VSGRWRRMRRGSGAGWGRRGYSLSAAANRLCQLDQVSRWLEREGLGVGELTAEPAGRFAAARRAAGRVTWASPRSMVLLLGYLPEPGVAPVPAAVAARGPLEELLADYRRYLRVERGCRITPWSMRTSRPPGCSWPGGSARVRLPRAGAHRLRHTAATQLGQRHWSRTEPAYASSLVAAASGGACRSRWDLTVTESGHGIASSGSSNAIETSSDGSCTLSI